MADDPLWAGVPSYVMQEEFDRYQGYWWQPHCKGNINYYLQRTVMLILAKPGLYLFNLLKKYQKYQKKNK